MPPRPLVLGTPTPPKVCQSILNMVVRSGLKVLGVERVTLDGRLWGADLSSVVFLVEALVSGGNGSRFCANAHLNDDETVAKMGHPNLLWARPGPPAQPPKRCATLRDVSFS